MPSSTPTVSTSPLRQSKACLPPPCVTSSAKWSWTTPTSRDVINGKITAILDEATDKWGIKVNRVEVKNIIPPREIQEAMEKQMKAEREKRAVILKADGEKQAAITAAEGEKEAAILRADAVKQQRILEAEGEAQAILAVQKANADAIRLLNEAMPSDKVLAIRSPGSSPRWPTARQPRSSFLLGASELAAWCPASKS